MPRKRRNNECSPGSEDLDAEDQESRGETDGIEPDNRDSQAFDEEQFFKNLMNPEMRSKVRQLLHQADEKDQQTIADDASNVPIQTHEHPKAYGFRGDAFVFKYGPMSFASESKELAREFLQRAALLFEKPLDGQFKCCGCAFVGATAIELQWHNELGYFRGECQKYQEVFPITKLVLNSCQPGFIVTEKHVQILNHTPTLKDKNGMPLRAAMLDVRRLPYSTKHHIAKGLQSQSAKETNLNSMRQCKSLWDFYKARIPNIISRPDELAGFPEVLFWQFLMPHEKWPQEVVDLVRIPCNNSGGSNDDDEIFDED